MATKAFYLVMKADLFDFLGLHPTICLLFKQISDNTKGKCTGQMLLIHSHMFKNSKPE